MFVFDCISNVFTSYWPSSDSIHYSITPPKPPVFEGTLTTDAAPASEEKGMSIPVIGSSEFLFWPASKQPDLNISASIKWLKCNKI